MGSWLGWLAGLTDRVDWSASCIGWSNVLLIKDTYSCFETWDAKPLSLACTKGLIASEHRLRLMTVHAPDQTGLRPTSVPPPQRGVSVAALNWDAKPLGYNPPLRILTDLQNWSPSIIQRSCITHLLLALYERASGNIIQYPVSSTPPTVWTTLWPSAA